MPLGQNAVKWTKLSCYDFMDNHVRLQLFALVYNLGNFLRRLALPPRVKHWSLAQFESYGPIPRRHIQLARRAVSDTITANALRWSRVQCHLGNVGSGDST